MAEWLGRNYNYDVWSMSLKEFTLFKQIAHAGDPAPDFELPDFNDRVVKLSTLRGKPVLIEFGSIT